MKILATTFLKKQHPTPSELLQSRRRLIIHPAADEQQDKASIAAPQS